MFNFDVLVDGRPVKKYFDRNGQIWIEGRKGTAFTLKVKNNDYGRILGIVSVDGLNVIDGKHTPLEESRGYVINSHSNINIPGWKVNKSEVREFYFTINGENSYVRKIGADDRNIGVIAAAVYKELVKWPTYSTNYTSTVWDGKMRMFDVGKENLTGSINVFNSSTPIGASMDYDDNMSNNENSGYIKSASNTYLGKTRGPKISTSEVDRSMGFGYEDESSNKKVEKVSVGSGERVDFRTKTVDFERGNYEGQILIYYDTWEGLKDKGILRDDRDYRQRPEPFGTGDFCPDV